MTTLEQTKTDENPRPAPLSLRLTPDLESLLRARAQIEDRSLSSLVRQALRKYLEELPV